SILGKTIEDLVDESEKESVKGIDDISKPLKYLNLKYKFNNVEFYGEQTTIIKNRYNKILNISIIKNMEDKIKLAKIKEELEYNKTKEEIKDQVLANISHDFKTPINVIYSTVQMQDLNIKNKSYDNLLEFNNIIKQNCNRMIRLTNNFIDSIKLESNILNVDLKCVNIVNLVEEITLSVLNYAEDKDIELVFDTEKEEIYSLVDIDIMEKIMLNVLSNSIKYNKKNGSIDVKIKDTEQLIIISIKDTGVGIPKEKLKSIFERFERADRSTIKTSEGSGIGLSIVKQMVEALNGTIDISSVEDKGTMVKIILQKNNPKDLEIIDFNTEYLDERAKLELSDI
ncbi:MAG: HAMP domain-containing sensor histidine kinase, partial [Peptostreptococcaceae bacterium]|nr:HAMP domain-containing sensor histidine kinase [Peptostreptococcaceae bacterium]